MSGEQCWRCAEPSVIVRQGAGDYGLYGLCVEHLIGDTLTAALTAVSNAVRPLGAYGGATDSPWNRGYTQALNEATAALLALRSFAVSSRADQTDANGGPTS